MPRRLPLERRRQIGSRQFRTVSTSCTKLEIADQRAVGWFSIGKWLNIGPDNSNALRANRANSAAVKCANRCRRRV